MAYTWESSVSMTEEDSNTKVKLTKGDCSDSGMFTLEAKMSKGFWDLSSDDMRKGLSSYFQRLHSFMASGDGNFLFTKMGDDGSSKIFSIKKFSGKGGQAKLKGELFIGASSRGGPPSVEDNEEPNQISSSNATFLCKQVRFPPPQVAHLGTPSRSLVESLNQQSAALDGNGFLDEDTEGFAEAVSGIAKFGKSGRDKPLYNTGEDFDIPHLVSVPSTKVSEDPAASKTVEKLKGPNVKGSEVTLVKVDGKLKVDLNSMRKESLVKRFIEASIRAVRERVEGTNEREALCKALDLNSRAAIEIYKTFPDGTFDDYLKVLKTLDCFPIKARSCVALCLERRGLLNSSVGPLESLSAVADSPELNRIMKGWPCLRNSTMTFSHEDCSLSKLMSLNEAVAYLSKSRDRREANDKVAAADLVYTVHYQSVLRSLESIYKDGCSVGEHDRFKKRVGVFKQFLRGIKPDLPVDNKIGLFEGVNMKMCAQLSCIKLFLDSASASAKAFNYETAVGLQVARSKGNPGYLREMMAIVSRLRGNRNKTCKRVSGMTHEAERGDRSLKDRVDLLDKYRILSKNMIRHSGAATKLQEMLDSDILYKNF